LPSVSVAMKLGLMAAALRRMQVYRLVSCIMRCHSYLAQGGLPRDAVLRFDLTTEQ